MFTQIVKQKSRNDDRRPQGTDAAVGSGGENSRRMFIKGLAAALGTMLAGCGPVRYFTGVYDQHYSVDQDLRDRFLYAFVSAVVPGADLDNDSIRIFTDEYYPFLEHLPYFLADLARRSTDARGYDRFDLLTLEERAAVVADGLDGDFVASKLYTAAIFMAQVSVYAGIYDPERGCDLIDFPGANMGFLREEMCYADNARLISIEETTNGHIG